MAKSLRTLARQLKQNHGLTLVPTFDNGIRPGTLLHRNTWNNIDRVGELSDDRALRRGDYGPVRGPEPCMLADLNRTHELQLSAALDLLNPAVRARPEFSRAREAVASFDSPVTYTVSLIKLEDALESAEGLWERNVGQRLRMKKTRVVFQVVRGRVSFLFRGSSSSGIDLRGTALASLTRAELGARWRWRNEATIESRQELVIAVESARYLFKKRRFSSE